MNLYLDMGEVSNDGAVAGPSTASGEKGAEVMARMVDFVVEFLQVFRAMDTRAARPATGRATSVPPRPSWSSSPAEAETSG